MAKLNLGDSAFNKKMMVYYSWVTPIAFLGLTIVFLITKAWLPALLVLCIVLLSLPPLKEFLTKIRIHGTVKFILGAALLIAAIYSTSLYI